ncbi:MAG: HU family DNA-binding protein [Bacteroides sp.]|nr:HU family DNA-binding protein [Bacteroides sp.]
MNKAQLINAMSAEAQLSKTDAKKAVEAFIKTVTKAMTDGDKVTLVGFGTFAVGTRVARKGVDPSTRKAMVIPARKVVKFKAGVDLAEAVK